MDFFVGGGGIFEKKNRLLTGIPFLSIRGTDKSVALIPNLSHDGVRKLYDPRKLRSDVQVVLTNMHKVMCNSEEIVTSAN